MGDGFGARGSGRYGRIGAGSPVVGSAVGEAAGAEPGAGAAGGGPAGGCHAGCWPGGGGGRSVMTSKIPVSVDGSRDVGHAA